MDCPRQTSMEFRLRADSFLGRLHPFERYISDRRQGPHRQRLHSVQRRFAFREAVGISLLWRGMLPYRGSREAAARVIDAHFKRSQTRTIGRAAADQFRDHSSTGLKGSLIINYRYYNTNTLLTEFIEAP